MRNIMSTMKVCRSQPSVQTELLNEVEDGLAALGYGSDDVDQLVEGALPQDRVNKLAPRYDEILDRFHYFTNTATQVPVEGRPSRHLHKCYDCLLGKTRAVLVYNLFSMVLNK